MFDYLECNMQAHWVYNGVVKCFVNGRVEIVGRAADNGLAYWRLFQHSKLESTFKRG